MFYYSHSDWETGECFGPWLWLMILSTFNIYGHSSFGAKLIGNASRPPVVELSLLCTKIINYKMVPSEKFWIGTMVMYVEIIDVFIDEGLLVSMLWHYSGPLMSQVRILLRNSHGDVIIIPLAAKRGIKRWLPAFAHLSCLNMSICWVEL